MRPNCECRGKDLLAGFAEAVIGTSSAGPAGNRSHGVCGDYSGECIRRPIRGRQLLAEYPASTRRVHKPMCSQIGVLQ